MNKTEFMKLSKKSIKDHLKLLTDHTYITNKACYLSESITDKRIIFTGQ